MTEDAYLAEIVSLLQAALGPGLAGVYAGGSYALGGYEQGRSDLDVAAVVRRPLTPDEKTTLVQNLRHEVLPCPARGLELVVYTRDAAGSRDVRAPFELNLNTGAGMEFRTDAEPVEGELHWFALDRSVLARHGVALAGPPAGEVFADPGRNALLPVLAESLRWFLAGGTRDDAVLNACRAARFAEEDAWTTKRAAGQWAVGRLGEDALVLAALRARGTTETLEPERVRAFVERVLRRLAA
jgi:predicted nucleotidyltransferase